MGVSACGALGFSAGFASAAGLTAGGKSEAGIGGGVRFDRSTLLFPLTSFPCAAGLVLALATSLFAALGSLAGGVGDKSSGCLASPVTGAVASSTRRLPTATD